MFSKVFKKASNKVEGAVETAAVEAALGLTTILLACGAFVFAAVAFAWWLSTLMPVYFALLIVAAATALCALFVYFWGVHSSSSTVSEKSGAAEADDASPLSLLFTNMGMRGTPLDIAAKGLFIRQLKHAPVSTIAATVAIGALTGMLMSEDDDE
ncbi:MAG: hypothetical protein HKP25_03195 [Marinicaulis sp.]|nr:hypothetical protein [Marinicaulis sp.]